MQKNAILLGGPRHGKMVPFAGPYVLFEEIDLRHRRVRPIWADPPESIPITRHFYRWEMRGRTIFGVYQKPKEQP